MRFFFTKSKYFAYPQPRGKVFKVGKLLGYFNDLTHKTKWRGKITQEGIPVINWGEKETIFMINVFQKALGHWDLYLISGDKHQRDKFLNLCNFACKLQDEKGGWKIWDEIGVGKFYQNSYSALSQGQAISCMTRAYNITGEKMYIERARKAYNLLLTSIDNGGVLRKLHGEQIILEEYPKKRLSGVLNGWIYAIYGIYDLLLIEHKEEYKNFLLTNLFSLSQLLARYDTGYWSFYDLEGRISSSFYHHLHITLLLALAETFPNFKKFEDYANKFKQYTQRATNIKWAFLFGLIQRIKNPPPAIPLIK